MSSGYDKGACAWWSGKGYGWAQQTQTGCMKNVVSCHSTSVGACSGAVTQKLIRVKSDPAGSLLVAIIDPAGSLLAAKSDPPLQKVIRVQILVDSSLF